MKYGYTPSMSPFHRSSRYCPLFIYNTNSFMYNIMNRLHNKWATAGIVFITSAFIMLAVCLVIFRSHRPELNFVPHMLTSQQVVRMSAELNGTFCGLPITGTFTVPAEYYSVVRSYFSGQIRPWEIHNERVLNDVRLGQIHCDFQDGQHLDLVFYFAGKGVIGFSIGHDYFVADTGKIDGGSHLLFDLDKARPATVDRSITDRPGQGVQ